MRQAIDFLVTRTWEILLARRRVARTHVKVDLAPLEADFWADPGPRLPAWMGLLADIATTRLVVGESETGQLTVEEVLDARLELLAGWRLHQQQRRRAEHPPSGEVQTPDSPDACLLIVAERASARTVRSALRGPGLSRLEPGLWYYQDTFPVYIVSLSALAFRDDTAPLHLLGRGPKRLQALQWLGRHPDPEVQQCALILRQEVGRMSIGQTVKKEAPEFTESDLKLLREESEYLDSLLTPRARQRAERRGWRAGRKEGKQEGRVEGVRSACLELWRRRFGEPDAEVIERLQGCDSYEALSQLLLELAESRELEHATRLVANLPTSSR